MGPGLGAFLEDVKRRSKLVATLWTEGERLPLMAHKDIDGTNARRLRRSSALGREFDASASRHPRDLGAVHERDARRPHGRGAPLSPAPTTR